jgi:hypothetical protein
VITFDTYQMRRSLFCDPGVVPAALYGLIGALGGAIITAVAAYWGPLQAQRRATVAAAEQRG